MIRKREREEGSWRTAYPFASHELDLGGLRYHYVDEGDGAPLLMVHGNPTWSFYYRNLIKAFRDQFRVIVPDHMGCGLSDKPQQYAYSLSQHIENLVALVERLDLRRVTLAVHDWGGAIGLGTALRLAERFDRLVLFNTGAFPPPFVPFRIRVCRTPWIGEWAMRKLNLFAVAALWMAMERPRRLGPEGRAGLIAPYDSWDHRIAIDRFVRDIPFTRRHPTWKVLEQIEQQLPRLADRPTIMIWGMKDWCFTPACMERLHRSLPRAEISPLDDAGHYVIEDSPEQVIAHMQDFFSRHPLP